MKKSLLLISILVLSAALFSACTSSPTSTQTSAENPGATEKQGDTTLTGTLTQKGGVFFVERPGEMPQTIESYSVDLASYINQNVTIVGQFSGDTLFAGTIQSNSGQ